MIDDQMNTDFEDKYENAKSLLSSCNFNPFNAAEMLRLSNTMFIYNGLWRKAVDFYNSTRQSEEGKVVNCRAFYGTILRYLKSLPPQPCVESLSCQLSAAKRTRPSKYNCRIAKTAANQELEFDSMAAKITQPFSIDKSIRG